MGSLAISKDRMSDGRLVGRKYLKWNGGIFVGCFSEIEGMSRWAKITMGRSGGIRATRDVWWRSHQQFCQVQIRQGGIGQHRPGEDSAGSCTRCLDLPQTGDWKQPHRLGSGLQTQCQGTSGNPLPNLILHGLSCMLRLLPVFQNLIPRRLSRKLRLLLVFQN